MTAPIWINGNHGKWQGFLVVLLVFILGLSCTSVHAICPGTFMDVDTDVVEEKCVAATTATVSTIAEARVACQAMGRQQGVDADLAKIQSSDLAGLTGAGLTEIYWVGLTDAAFPTAEEWVIDCTPYNGMLDPFITADTCTGADCFCFMYNAGTNQLTEVQCLSTTLPALCQISQPDDFPEIICPRDYVAIKDRCYRFYSDVDPAVDFGGAEAMCQNEGGNLARANQYDCNFAEIYDRADDALSYLIGLQDDGAGNLLWRDGTQPSVLSAQGMGPCFILDASNTAGVYSRQECTNVNANFICEQDAVPPTTPAIETTAGDVTTGGPATTGRPATTDGPATTGVPATTGRPATTGVPATTERPGVVTTAVADVTTADGLTTRVEATTDRGLCCPAGSELIGDSCFAIVTTSTTSFNNAVTQCEELGGSLARVDPPEVNQFIVDYFEANPAASSVWIGLLRSVGDSGDVFTWVADNTVLIDNQAFWADGQPTGASGVNCVYAVNAVGNIGNWFLSNCFTQFDYLCQFDLTDDCVDTGCNPSPCDISGPGQIMCTTPGFGISQCTCNDGGFELQTALGPCIDINECDQSPCDTVTQTCANFDGGFQCDCITGLQPDPANPSGPCIPIDVCENVVCDTGGPGQIFCNADGLCECTSSGFQLQQTNGPCINVNECAGDNDCDVDTTTCVDIIGSFNCPCRDGFEPIVGNAFACSPIAEPCNPNPCDAGEFNNIICNPTTGACSCPTGYELSGGSATGPCININECTFSNGGCNAATSTCVDNNGGFTCECNTGFEPGSLAFSCDDINECSTNNGDCSTFSTDCVNTFGSFTCQCKDGFERNSPTSCNDINECTENTDNCDDTSTNCQNSPGTFTCPCRTNYVPTSDTSICQDVCTAGQSACDVASTTCVFNSGVVSCECLQNFEPIDGDNTACQEVETGCCPVTGNAALDDDFYLTPSGICVLFDSTSSATFDNFRDTECVSSATSHEATGGQLLVLSSDLVHIDVSPNDGIPDLEDLVTRQSQLINTFPPAVYVNFRRTSDGNPFTWADGTVIPNNDENWATGSPLSGSDLHCGVVIPDGSSIGLSNVMCTRTANAFCSVDTVTCPQALTARVLIPITQKDDAPAEFIPEYEVPNSKEFKEIAGIVARMLNPLPDRVNVATKGITKGSIVAHVELTVPKPHRIRDYEMLEEAIRQLGETENGYTTIKISTGETIVLDSNRLDVNDRNKYVCLLDTCMNGGTCTNNERLIQAECHCMEGFQGDRCEAFMDDTSTVLIVVLSVATVVMVIVFISCFCCLLVLSRNRSQQNKMVYQYRPPISEVFAPRSGPDQRVVVNTAAARVDGSFRRPVNIPRVVKNRGLDRGTEMDSYDNPSVAYDDEPDVESSVDQKRLSHFERVFYNATELNSRMSSRGDAASVSSRAASSMSSMYKPPLSDVMEPVDETREFNTPYTADGTENI